MLDIRRREFITLIGSAVLARPDLGRAQTAAGAGKRPVIGILALNASEKDMGFVTPFLDALAKLGYVDGKSATIVSLYAAGEQRLLPMLAGNLVRLKPDVIMADTASPIKAVRSAAPGIPIVGAIMGYPVEQGLITSFSHPGGNVTGMAASVEDMNGKILELGMEMVSGAKSMGLLIDPGASQSTFDRRDFQAAAEKRASAFILRKHTYRTSSTGRSRRLPMPVPLSCASQRAACSISICATLRKRHSRGACRRSPETLKSPTQESCCATASTIPKTISVPPHSSIRF
jgi:putative ABC transport system substrate-binding protein